MRSLKHSKRRIAGVVAFGFRAGLLISVHAQDSDPDLAMGVGKAQYYSLPSVSVEQMDAADATLLRSEQSELDGQARFFGYDLSQGEWQETAARCGIMPDTLMLHFKRTYPDGAESLFTALVPRSGGKVQVVPVYYHSATPFHPAAKSPRNMAIFNRAVPAEIAESLSRSTTKWLEYGVCYAELVGGPMSVLLKNGDSARMYTVAPPSVDLSNKFRTAEIQFSDRFSVKHYSLWTLELNNHGRLRKARYSDEFAAAPRVSNPSVPRGLSMPSPPQPRSRTANSPSGP